MRKEMNSRKLSFLPDIDGRIWHTEPPKFNMWERGSTGEIPVEFGERYAKIDKSNLIQGAYNIKLIRSIR